LIQRQTPGDFLRSQFLVDDLARSTIVRPLTATSWSTMDCYVKDPDGHVLSFDARPSTG